MINITTISDTHDKHSLLDVGSGDLIIHAGDCTGRGSRADIEEFLRWYGDLDFEMKILIPGNHDFDFERNPELCDELCKNYGVVLLNDSGVKFKGLNIWGSPVQPWFHNWAFNRMRSEAAATAGHPFIGKHWDKIPKKTDILITHGPPYGILDTTARNKESAGCEELLKKVEEIRPVLHVFGHIHEERGVFVDKTGPTPITYVNTSSLDLQYKPYREKAFKFDWNDLIIGQTHGEE
jgi:Icc-related predicted phosphoesterase